MDFLNKAFTQIGDLFKSLSPGARITSGLLLVVVVVSLVYLFRTQTTTADAYLMGGEPFSASQLPAMEAAFSKAGLNSYEIDGNRIRVPRGQQSLYMGALADEGALPPDFGKYLEKALGSDSVWLSRAKQVELLRVAKQNELQLILSRMKGVESASVLYDERKAGSFGGKILCTASVNIKPTGSQPLEEERIPMIRHLVASAFAGLRPESVSVTDLNGRTYSGSDNNGTGGSVMEDAYIMRKRAHEKDWEQKVRNQLEYIQGVVVSTNVELVRDTEFEEEKTTLDPKGVIYQSNESTSSKTSEGPAPVGRPGAVAQQPGGANQPGAVGTNAGGPKTSEETAHLETGTAIPTTVTHRKQQGLTPERVKVAVGIPSNYYTKVYAERNPVPPGEEPKQPDAAALAEIERAVKEDVKNAVVALLPATEPGKDPFPQVTVTSFQHITTTPPAVPGLQDHAMVWLGNYGTTVGMGGLALVSLLLLRSVVKSAPSASAPAMPAPINTPAPSLSLMVGDDDEPAAESEEAPVPPRARLKRRAAAGGPSLRDELATIVKEDPDAAVAVLRNWIGSSA